VFTDAGTNRPRRLAVYRPQRTGRARLRAVAAKRAFAFAKIDGWIATIAGDDDVGRTVYKAFAAATAGAQKIVFRLCPGRP
jgi:hypothetical protein